MPTTRSQSQKRPRPASTRNSPLPSSMINATASMSASPANPPPVGSPLSLTSNETNLSLIPGCKLLVEKQLSDGTRQYRKAEVMAVRTLPTGRVQYYVHFMEFNKRLDEWVGVERMDLSTLELAGGRPGTPSTLSTPLHSSVSNKKRSATPTPSQLEGVEGAEGVEDEAIESPPMQLTAEQEMEQLRRGGSMTRRPEEIARVKNFDSIELGKYLVDTWYFSSYPESVIASGTVYLCEFCLGYFGSRMQLARHRTKCTLTHPPGTEIYRKDAISFWELDGHRQKHWCRNLCLLSKLFLDHKTLFYDVDPFLFYVLTETDARGSHILGYFSKEKESTEGYNLACILTLPQHQRKGYGRLLIEFSYELSKRQGKVGSPEKPLSDLGLLSYRSYWTEQLMRLLLEAKQKQTALSIESLSNATGITREDVVHTLQALEALKYRRGQYVIAVSQKMTDDYQTGMKKLKVSIDPRCLNWTPPQFTAADLRFL